MVAATAFFHIAYFALRSSSDIRGSNRRSSFQLFAKPATLFDQFVRFLQNFRITFMVYWPKPLQAGAKFIQIRVPSLQRMLHTIQALMMPAHEQFCTTMLQVG